MTVDGSPCTKIQSKRCFAPFLYFYPKNDTTFFPFFVYTNYTTSSTCNKSLQFPAATEKSNSKKHSFIFADIEIKRQERKTKLTIMNYGTYGRDLLLELKRTETNNTSSTTSGTNSCPTIPPYNDTLVTNALQELKLHVVALNEQVEAATQSAASMSSSQDQDDTTKNKKLSMEVRPSLMLHEASIQRNKRCLLAYHNTRIQRIEQLHYWQNASSSTAATSATGNVSNRNNNNNSIPNLNPAECDYLLNYNKILLDYIQNTIPIDIGIDDLRTYAVMPPLTIDKIVVRVIDDTAFTVTKDTITTTSVNDENIDSAASTTRLVTVVEPIVLESGQTVTFSKGSTHYLLYTDVETYVRSGILQIVHTEENEG